MHPTDMEAYMTNLSRALVIAGLVAPLGCGDAVGPPRVSGDLDILVPELARGNELWVTTEARDRRGPHGLRPSPILIPPDDGGGSELPPEWQQAPSIGRYWTDAGFGTSSAWGQGFMEYFASHASQVVRLSLRLNESQIAATSATSERSSLIPWTRDLWTTASLSLAKKCGHSLDAATEHRAWHQPPAPFGRLASWGNQAESSWKPATQAPCAPEVVRDTVERTETDPASGSDGPGGTGGGGSGGWYICYYYVEYDALTGQILYWWGMGCVPLGG